MKYVNVFFLFVFPVLFLFNMAGFEPTRVTPNHGQNTYEKIDSLLDAKSYFSARELYTDNYTSLSEIQQLKAGVFLDYVFNRADSSIEKMNRLISGYSSELSDTLIYEVLSVGQVNYSRLYEYKKAKETIEHLLDNYPQLMTENEKKDLENTLLIWTALQDQSKQQVIIHETVDMAIVRDKVGLQNLEVSAGAVQQYFVFDTGANLSTITESTAEEFGLNILDQTFDVQGISGQAIRSRIAVAPEISLGNMVIQNAVFMVFPDNALTFPQVDYRIHGILGFPVIEAMKEIQLTKENRFIVPVRQSSFKEQNLAIDFLTPLIFLKDDRGKGTYTFDTGAASSTLYHTYYRMNETELSRYTVTDLSLGGAGGHITKKGVYITFKPKIHGTAITLDSTIVLKEPLDPDNPYLGNIGQDLISRFNKVTINFSNMFVAFH